MKKYRVSAQPLIGEGVTKEYVVEAENEEAARKLALDRLIAEESNDGLLDSPNYMLTAEAVGYFYGHENQPRTITDLIDNIEMYVEEMRKKDDEEIIPKYLKQYAWEYFREKELSKDDLKKLAIFVVDRTYRIAAELVRIDKYTRAYFTLVIPFFWDTLQDRGIDIFYIVDNTFKEDRKFEAI